MASLKRIESMTNYLTYRGLVSAPPWILGVLNEEMHISGELRKLSDALWARNDELTEVSILLTEAAEKLDDAHEEWLEEQDPTGTSFEWLAV